ncbi:MAG: hypothetical protein F6K16_05665 [Symploca sp. SIO2B6]|nr:hypothetical protein [Symploca sp. SIO2B6]
MKSQKTLTIYQPPTLRKMTITFLKLGWRVITEALKGKNILVAPQVVSTRRSICSQCEYYQQPRCGHCGCFLPTKTLIRAAQCPINKWSVDSRVDIKITTKTNQGAY